MNPDTEKNINEAFDWLQKTGGQIQDLASDQAPIYCREVVAWQFWCGLFEIPIGIGIICLAIYCFKKGKDSEYNDFPLYLAGALCGLAGLFITIFSAENTIKAAVAPRVVIVEHLRGLTK